MRCSVYLTGVPYRESCKHYVCGDCLDSHFYRVLDEHTRENKAYAYFRPGPIIDPSVIHLLPEQDRARAAADNARLRPTYKCPVAACDKIIEASPKPSWLKYAATVRASKLVEGVDRPQPGNKIAYDWDKYFSPLMVVSNWRK